MVNWLTKRFWSNQVGDQLPLMQLAVVGVTLAMALVIMIIHIIRKYGRVAYEIEIEMEIKIKI